MKLKRKHLRRPRHDFEDRCTIVSEHGPDHFLMADGSICRHATAQIRQAMLQERKSQ